MPDDAPRNGANVPADTACRTAPPPSEAAFHHLADAMPHLVWTAGPDGRVDYYSRQAERYAGLQQQDDGAWEWAPVLHPEDAYRTTEAWRQAVDTGTPYEVEHRVRMRDGSYRWHVSRALPTRDAEGRVERWYGTATDIHRMREAEAGLRENEERLRRTQKSARLGTWDVDLATGEVTWSEGVFELVGLSPEEGVPDAEVWQRLLHPDDRRRVSQEVEAILKIGGPYENEFRIVRPDGDVVWLAAQGDVLRDASGRPVRFLGVNYDITSRKRAEEALRRSEEHFRTLANNIAQLAWMADADGWIYWYNQRWFDYTGTTLDDMEGWGWNAVHHPDHIDRVVEKISRCFETGEPWEDTFPLRGADGTYRWFLSRAIPVRDASGTVVRWFGTNTDITERLRLERSMQKLNRTLEVRVKEQTQQVRELSRALVLAEQEERQRIAHILHDDLQQIIFGAKLAGSLGEPEQLETILDEALALTRSLSHELSPPLLKGEDVEDLLRWMAEKKLERYGLQVEVKVGDDVRIPDPTLRVLLYQLLRELLFNVVKHAGIMQARLTAERGEESVRVIVEDDGAGFDPADLNHSDSDGLGLLSVRERLELIGGRLDVASTPGEGTRVTITVPVFSE